MAVMIKLKNMTSLLTYEQANIMDVGISNILILKETPGGRAIALIPMEQVERAETVEPKIGKREPAVS